MRTATTTPVYTRHWPLPWTGSTPSKPRSKKRSATRSGGSCGSTRSSQVVSFTDAGLERDYRFCRALASFAKRPTGDTLALGSEVELTHVQLEQTFEGVSLETERGVVTTIYSGTGRAHELEVSPLSHIIERLNERFGLKLTEAGGQVTPRRHRPGPCRR